MTTLSEARHELVEALATAAPDGQRAVITPDEQAPYYAVLGGGIATERIVMGQVEATFRIACVAGRSDNDASVDELDAMKLLAVATIRSLAGWRAGEVRPDGIRSFGGADLLSADVLASRLINL